MNKLFEKLKYLLPLIGAYLGALGGQGTKQWRRIVLPIILAGVAVLSLESWYGLTFGIFGAFASMGYGIPDDDYPNSGDAGSTLGRFWWNLFNKNHLLADIFTRGTVGLGMAFVGLAAPILKENWLMYIVGCLCILVGQTVFSYRGWGVVSVFRKNLLVSDLINYFLIFLGYTIMLVTI